MWNKRILGAAALVAFAAALVAIVGHSGGGGSPPLERLPAGRPDGSPPPQPAGTAERMPVSKAIWGPVKMPDGSSAFPTYKRLGVDVFQIQLRWADIAPRPPANPRDPDDPAYSWPTEVDFALTEARRKGISVAILITTSPGWANGGGAEIDAPDPSEYADFATAAARRYPEVDRWMVWGEPNRDDRFLPNAPNDPRGPRRYAELLDAAYSALKAVTSRNVVIGGNVFTGGDVKPPDFIRWMRLPSGRPPRLDWFGANPYPFRLPDLAAKPIGGGWRDLSDIDTLGEEVDAAYRPLGMQPRLWLSEFTVQNGQDSRYFNYHVSAAEQARWLKQGYRVAEESGDVAGLGWFTLLDQPPGPESANWGLMTADEARKPSFRAYASILGR